VNANITTTKLPSHSTLYCALKIKGLINFRCKKRPKLDRGHAAKHLKFAREYKHFACGQRTLRFSVEYSIQKGSGANQEWCFRFL
jgi:hypothetical protein